MYCRHCGSVVSEQQKFCKQCGREQQPEMQNQIESMIVSTAGVVVWICMIFWLVIGMKMIGDDNYLGVVASMVGAGAVIAAFYQWEKRRQKIAAFQESSSLPMIERREPHYLSPPSEAASVVEDETKRFDTDKIYQQK